MQNSIKEIISGSVLGIVGKVVTALLNFISLPILISIYGKSSYGLVGVALSTNAFLQLLNMGIPMGAVKHFSQWVVSKDFESLKRGVQTNTCFFGVVGFINSCILIYIGYNAGHYFNVEDPASLSMLIYTIAASSFINWYFITFQHLLSAYEKIKWVSLSNSIVSIFNFIAVIIAYFTHISLVGYFLLYSVSNIVLVVFNLIFSYRLGILKKDYFLPYFRLKEFRIIMSYSIALFGMAIIQYMANQSQPLILGAVAKNGDIAVADYRILSNITALVSMMGGIFLQNFLPFVAKAQFSGNVEQVKQFIFNSTKWLSMFIFFTCLYIAFNSEPILEGYVGAAGKHLHVWLSIWIIGLLYLNNQGISSFILSVGKFRPLIIGLSFATTAALLFTFFNVKNYGVGVTAISYLIYKTIEALFIYGYYLPKIAKISPAHLLNSSVKLPLIFSLLSMVVTKYICYFTNIQNTYFYLGSFFVIALCIYALLVWFYILNSKEKNLILQSFLFLKKGVVQARG